MNDLHIYQPYLKKKKKNVWEKIFRDDVISETMEDMRELY